MTGKDRRSAFEARRRVELGIGRHDYYPGLLGFVILIMSMSNIGNWVRWSKR